MEGNGGGLLFRLRWTQAAILGVRVCVYVCVWVGGYMCMHVYACLGMISRTKGVDSRASGIIGGPSIIFAKFA